jgi:hypothetical protein
MKYLMTKGTVSIVREDAAGVAEAEKRGFVCVGSCDESYKIIDPMARPVAPAPKAAKKAGK